MKIKLYQVDAFATDLFTGNPAAVCPLEAWLDDNLLQQIAEENNLSETAFFVSIEGGFELRWFTPSKEVELCGHATLAAAHVLYQHLGFNGEVLHFQTKSGELRASRPEQYYTLDFPASTAEPTDTPAALLAGLNGITPKTVLAAFDYIVVLDNEDDVKNLNPDFSSWLSLNLRGVVVTAASHQCDFVSRCFFPKLRVNEDPVTGSAHCELAPYWGKQLNKTKLKAIQLSARSGLVHCELINDRVILSGQAVDYMTGEVII